MAGERSYSMFSHKHHMKMKENEESFTISLRKETRTGLTQGKSTLCMDILSASYS